MPERWEAHVGRDPTTKFIEVAWWEPGTNRGGRYDVHKMYESTRVDTRDRTVDHVDVVAEQSILHCFEEMTVQRKMQKRVVTKVHEALAKGMGRF